MRLTLCFAAAVLILAAPAPAQSLGGLAAQEKARREKENKAKPAKVYTDQDLEARGATQGGPREAAPPPSPPSSTGSEPTGSPERSELEPDENSEIKARVAEAQAGLDSARQAASAAEAEVERLKQDLNPMSVTFKTDPYEILPLQAALTEAQARVAEAQKQVQAADAAMQAVRDEARRAGVRVP